MIDIMRDKPAIGRRRDVGILVYEGISLFEFSVAYDVFGADRSDIFGAPLYRLFVCGAAPGPVTADGGLQIEAGHGLERIARVDTVIVPPTGFVDRLPAEVFEVLRRAHARGQRLISLCTGAFVLAAAGVLDGRRATTHWAECDELSRCYPLVSVDPRVLYVDEGDVLTSAGSAASIDLCLHVVRRDHGAEIATQLARQLVVPPQRDGGQAQYIEAPLPELDDTHRFVDTLAWLQEHLDHTVTVEDLAVRSAMSPRTFARRFHAATGTTPYQWLLHQRVHLARRLLETSDLPIDVVADRSGFGTAANLRKHFGRLLATSPHAYRRTFRDRGAA
jgi:transcriptional regulator GlxA family with amidase domain